MRTPPSEFRVIGMQPQIRRTVRIAMLCGLVLYYGVIPVEFLLTGTYRVKSDFVDYDLASRALLDGPIVVALAFLGFWLGTIPLGRVGRNAMIRASSLGACAAEIATVLILAFAVLATRTEVFSKASSAEMAATLNNDHVVGFNSLVLTASAAAASIAAASFALSATTRRKSVVWLILGLVLGGIGLRLGDKDPIGASCFRVIASFAMRLRGNVLAAVVAGALCVAGLLAIPAASAVKFMFFGIDPDLSQLLALPSSSDPGGAFAIMATAMAGSMPLDMPGYNALAAILNDLGSAVPQSIWSSRPQTPGATLASFLMGSSYLEGYGTGYSPYVELYCALGHVGIAVAGLMIGWMVTLLLRIAAHFDSTGRLVQVCAAISFYVLVASQRLSLMGSLKQLVYYNATAIAAFLFLLLCHRERRSRIWRM